MPVTRSAAAAAQTATPSEVGSSVAPSVPATNVAKVASSGDTGGLRDWALLLSWCVCSYGLYAAMGAALSALGASILPPALASRLLGYLVAASAATLVTLLLFGRAVGRNAAVRAPNSNPAVRWHEEEGKSVLMPTIGFASRSERAAKRAAALPRYTLADVAKHCARDDLWIVVDEKAYDITAFVERHPGGVGALVAMAGKDCTDVFANYHAVKVYKYMLPRYLVGDVTDVIVWPHVADFRAVRQELLRRGLFETDYRYYAMLGSWFALLFFSALYLTLARESTAEHLAGAAAMGIFWQQLAGLGHDLGHSGVTHNFHVDHRVGSSLTALMGLSLCWWKSDHNTHHVVCNALEHDPNIQHMPMLAISSKIFAKPFWDTYHKRWVAMDALARFFVSYQHVIFYPLMALGRLNLYVQGLIYLIAQPGASTDGRTPRALPAAASFSFPRSRHAAWRCALAAHAPRVSADHRCAARCALPPCLSLQTKCTTASRSSSASRSTARGSSRSSRASRRGKSARCGSSHRTPSRGFCTSRSSSRTGRCTSTRGGRTTIRATSGTRCSSARR